MKRTIITLFALMPLAVSAEDVPGAHFIANWDQDGDGIISLAELRQKRSDVFYTFDYDESGFLDEEEYFYFDEARARDMESQGDHARGRMAHVQKGMTMDFNNPDGDEIVTEAEFLDKTEDWLVLIDRDGSGDVTSADFGPQS